MPGAKYILNHITLTYIPYHLYDDWYGFPAVYSFVSTLHSFVNTSASLSLRGWQINPLPDEVYEAIVWCQERARGEWHARGNRCVLPPVDLHQKNVRTMRKDVRRELLTNSLISHTRMQLELRGYDLIEAYNWFYVRNWRFLQMENKGICASVDTTYRIFKERRKD